MVRLSPPDPLGEMASLELSPPRAKNIAMDETDLLASSGPSLWAPRVCTRYNVCVYSCAAQLQNNALRQRL